ncbi:MAG: hypothetical protein E7305_02205 [Butyrivibrio sp.]|nr:hypothetical protein [Butyrivibrio sp.]
MMTLVVGVPDSGKSALAESLAVEQSEGEKRIYIATMIPFGQEGQNRVKKHRKLREGKGFFTVEAPVNVAESVKDLPEIGDATCLLECVSNLVGNVMHERELLGEEYLADAGNDGDLVSDDFVVDRVIADIKALCSLCKNLVVVTNSFPGDEESYDDDTIRYVKLLDRVNEELLGISDVVFELKEGEWTRRECL